MKDISANTSSSGNPLGYAPVLGLIGKFAIPSIISMLVAAAYNITDQQIYILIDLEYNYF